MRIPAELDGDNFSAIADLAHRESGLLLAPEKRLMVQSRLRHRLRALQIPCFDEYRRLVCSEEGKSERRMMVSALTTNVSHFYRESHHFDILSETLLSEFGGRAADKGRLRIWSAGCSNGQEPYSIAMHILRTLPDLARADIRILATDIDPTVLDFGAAGRYDAKQLGSVSIEDRERFFTCRRKGDADEFLLGDEVRRLVAFRELNLLSDWPMQQEFDAIFCRNVMIYFDVETQARLWPRFRGQLREDGLLFLGHSERICTSEDHGFTNIGPTAYRKSGTVAADPETGVD